MATVLVTGASGYIACHIVKLLLERGYNVRGTVRNVLDTKKCDPLRQIASQSMQNHSKDSISNVNGKSQLELVEADLLQPEGWQEAVKGCDYVIHTASPFPAKLPKCPEELIKPAVDGTLTVLKACETNKTVKRVVLTSSVAAIMGDLSKSSYNESDWTDISRLDMHEDTYTISKTLAEKAAWDFIKEKNNPFELAVINPGFVMGPLLQSCYCTSMEFLKHLMNFEMPMVPKVSVPVADVRDVAEAHVRALINPEANGNRHIIATSTLWIGDVANVLKQEFKPQGYHIPTLNAPHFLLWVASFWDKKLKLIVKISDKFATYDNTRMQKTLGIVPRKVESTIIDMAYTLIEKGFVKKTAKYIPRPENS